jgi:hypothetical protein
MRLGAVFVSLNKETADERQTRMREKLFTLSLTSAELIELAQDAAERARDITTASERTVAESRRLRADG